MIGLSSVVLILSYTIRLACTRPIANTYEIRDLFSTLPEFTTAESLWSSYSYTPKDFTCDNLPYFGGQQLLWYGRTIETTYNIPITHNVIYISVMISISGSWYSNEGIIMTVSSGGTVTSIFDWSHTMTLHYSPCDINDIRIIGRVLHSGPSLTLNFAYRTYNYAGYFGIRDVHIRSAYEVPALQNVCVVSEYYIASNIGIGNKCDCRISQYKPDSLTPCQDCHPSCEGCNGPLASDCFTCKFGYYHDGTQCVQCSSTCTNCETCQFCSGNDYYMDGVCVKQCELPFLKVISSDHRYCLSPCPGPQVIYADGTCRSTCVSPFIYPPATDYTRQVCQSPCSSNQILLKDGSCSSSFCEFPRFIKLYSGSMGVCEYPCPTYPSEIFYKHNSSCMPACNFPFIIVNYSEFNVCERPCPINYYYQYWDSTCQANCLSLLQKRNVEGVLVCDPPQCGARFCDLCSIGNTCREYYYCNTTNGKFCFPYHKHSLQIEIIKSLVNGARLSVKVIPIIDVILEDEKLEMEIPNLHLNFDYKFKVVQVSKGNFEVEIVFLHPTNSTLDVSFVYAPDTLLITSEYTLPRLIFINQDLIGVSQNAQRGSQIAFLVFVITVASMVLSGGLSALWTSMPESQYTYYLLYLNIDFLHHTEIYFESLSSYDILVSGSDDSQGSLDTTLSNFLPRKFFLRNYSPDFVENCGQLVQQAVITLSVLGLVALATKYIHFSGRTILLLKGLVFIRNSLHWNLIIRQMMTYTLPVLIACFIQIYSSILGQNVSWLPLILSLMMIIVFVLFFVKTFNLLNNIPRVKYHRVIYSKRYGTLWEELDISKKTRYYYWLITLRACLLAYVSVFCSVLPYLQIIILIIYQIFIVSLFICGFSIRQVFHDKTLNKITLIEEACLLIVKFLMLVFQAMLGMKAEDKLLVLIGWMIVLAAAVAQATQIFYSIWTQLSDCNRFLKLYRLLKSVTGKKRIKKILRIKKIDRRIAERA